MTQTQKTTLTIRIQFLDQTPDRTDRYEFDEHAVELRPAGGYNTVYVVDGRRLEAEGPYASCLLALGDEFSSSCTTTVLDSDLPVLPFPDGRQTPDGWEPSQ